MKKIKEYLKTKEGKKSFIVFVISSLFLVLLILTVVLSNQIKKTVRIDLNDNQQKLNSSNIEIIDNKIKMNDNYYYWNYNNNNYVLPSIHKQTDSELIFRIIGDGDNILEMREFSLIDFDFNFTDYTELLNVLEELRETIDIYLIDDFHSTFLLYDNLPVFNNSFENFDLTNSMRFIDDEEIYRFEFNYNFSSPYLFNLGYSYLDLEDNSIDLNMFTDSFRTKSVNFSIYLEVRKNHSLSSYYLDLKSVINYDFINPNGISQDLSYELSFLDLKDNPFNLVYQFNPEDIASYNLGYADGKEDGYFLGNRDGKKEGISIGKEQGLEQGYENGFNDGKVIGYNDGKADGMNIGTDSWGVIFKAWLGTFGILSFEVLPGVTIGTLLFFPVIIGMLSFIVGVATFSFGEGKKKK